MNKIEFRVWKTFQKQGMFYPREIRHKDGFLSFVGLPEVMLSKADGDILMQYTGLKDKRGSKIFEGDILCGDTALGNCFAVDMMKFDVLQHIQDLGEKDYFIGGNVYENPDLLSPTPKAKK